MFQETIPRFCHRNQVFFLKKINPADERKSKKNTYRKLSETKQIRR